MTMTNNEMNYYNYGRTLSAEGIVKSWLLNGKENHETVDLGLPSGTLWATENIKDADGKDLYFAWGETQGYTAEQVGVDKNFNWDDYKFGSDEPFTKYNETDGKTELDPEDDAATVNWGSSWRMPTKEQYEELTANTTSAWTQVDGVSGMMFTSTSNGNTLFLPAVGIAYDGIVEDVGYIGDYWSLSLDDEHVNGAFEVNFNSNGYTIIGSSRSGGYTVHPVRTNK